MHELGVVFHIMDRLEEVAKQSDVSSISKVVLDLGEVNGVVPDLLENCWNWAVKKSPLLEHAALDIQIVPALSYCEDCKKEFVTVKYGKTCPYCHGGSTWLLQGDEFMIRQIECPQSQPEAQTSADPEHKPESEIPQEEKEKDEHGSCQNH